jgi:hypothetical protein
MRLWLFIGLCFIAGHALADVYAFVGFNQMRVSVEGKGAQEEDRGAILGLGYRFTPRLAAEISYADGHVVQGQTVVTEWRSRGLGIVAVGTMPLRGGFAAVGRAGVHGVEGRWHQRLVSAPINTTLEEIRWSGWAPRGAVQGRRTPRGPRHGRDDGRRRRAGGLALAVRHGLDLFLRPSDARNDAGRIRG